MYFSPNNVLVIKSIIVWAWYVARIWEKRGFGGET